MKFIKNLFFNVRKALFVLFFAFKDKKSPLYVKIISIIAFLYLFFPIDIVPDILLPAGLIDDLAIVPALLYFAYKGLPKESIEEAKNASQQMINKTKTLLIIASILAAALFIGIIFIIISLIIKR